ncbi:MAG: polysaccharide biosynthesis tyrosine autokinase [Acidobacteria bacterium]|nr:MAG: polysaccharide biosynthesis tyrosine autokinase [Acidobacteriota bacterium]
MPKAVQQPSPIPPPQPVAGRAGAPAPWWQATEEAGPQAERPAGSGTPWVYYGRLLQRNLWRLVTFVCVVTAVATLIALTRPKQYAAVTTLQVDALGAQVVGDEHLQRASTADSDALVLTDQTVMTSPAVLLQVVEQLHLQDNPAFRAPSHPNLTPSPDDVLRQLSNGVSVSRPPASLLLNVSYQTQSATLAAQIANAIANSFLNLEYNSRAQALNQSTAYMSGQLDNLRAQTEQAQQNLVSYESRANILDPDSKDNIMVARLTELNSDLTKAKSQRMQMQAAVRVIDSGAAAGWTNPTLTQEVQTLRGRLQTDQNQLQVLGQIYGTSHPRYRQQSTVVRRDEEAVQQAQARLAGAARAQFVAARLQEMLLEQAVAQQKQAMDQFERRAITYRSLQAAAQNYTKLYYDLLQRIAESKLAAGFHTTNARVVSPARPDFRPVAPRPKLTAAVALLLSLLAGVGFVLARDALDQSVASAEQVELLFRVPVLGLLPLLESENELQLAGGGSEEDREARHPYHEAIVSLQSAILLGAAEARVVAITSALPAEGKSTAAGHLAASMAQMGQSTLLVDGDLRKPRVHRLFGVANQRGLSPVLRGTMDLEAALQPSRRDNLTLLTAGPTVTNSAELLQQHWPAVLDRLRERFDRVIIDCGPTLGFADSGAIARDTDALVLLVRAGKTARNLVRGALRQLRTTGVDVTGIVLNCVSARLDPYYYYQSAYHNYYNSDGDGEESE